MSRTALWQLRRDVAPFGARADVGLYKGWRVIDAVADHGHDLAFALEEVNQVKFLPRAYAGEHLPSCHLIAHRPVAQAVPGGHTNGAGSASEASWRSAHSRTTEWASAR